MACHIPVHNDLGIAIQRHFIEVSYCPVPKFPVKANFPSRVYVHENLDVSLGKTLI